MTVLAGTDPLCISRMDGFFTQTYLDVESEASVFIRLHFDQHEVVVRDGAVLHREEEERKQNACKVNDRVHLAGSCGFVM